MTNAIQTTRRRHIGIILLLLLVLHVLTITNDAQTDDTNLLENPGFNDPGQYRPATDFPRFDFNFASGWQGWYTNEPSTEPWMNINPVAYPHTGNIKRDGNAAQQIGRGDATFTAAAYQIVQSLNTPSTLRASAWVYQENTDNSDARTRIGIGRGVGNNPQADSIVWSDWLTSLNEWSSISVEADVAAGEAVTVFIYSTQSFPNIFPGANNVYYDDASLIIVESLPDDDVPPVSATEDATDPTPSPTAAPDDNVASGESIEPLIHSVVEGDTLAAIAVQYGVTVDQIRELNDIQGNIITIGQLLIIRAGTATEEATSTDASTDTSSTETSTDDPITTDSAEEPVTAEPTPNVTATPTIIPPTPTDAPPAPVEQGTTLDPLDISTSICVLMYADNNRNNILDGEPLLSGGIIRLLSSEGNIIQAYNTLGRNEPHCFDDLTAGTYTIVASPPEGYGMARSSRLVVNVQAGQRFPVRFGAVEGLEVTARPTAIVSTDVPAADNTPIVEEQPDLLDNLRNIAGIIVLGLAGIVLIGGISIAVITSRD